MTEEELIKACLAFDSRAQKKLFDTYSPRFYGVCLRYASGHDQANDMLQDGFIKIFQKLKTYSGDGSFAGWMHRIVVNTCLDEIRKNKKELGHVELENAEGKVFTKENATSDLGEKELLKLVQQLPEGYRVVFNLFAIEGFGHKEIAEKLGVSENTSKSQYRKARFWLQEAIKELNK